MERVETMPWAHAPWNILQEGRDAEDAEAGHCVHESIEAHFEWDTSPNMPASVDAKPSASPDAGLPAIGKASAIQKDSAVECGYSIVIERWDGNGVDTKETRTMIFAQRVLTLDLVAVIKAINNL